MAQPADTKVIEVEGNVAITQEEALKAAKAMLARGIKFEDISLRKVQKELGNRGSLVTIGKALATLEAELSAALKTREGGDGPPGAPLTPETPGTAGKPSADGSPPGRQLPETDAEGESDKSVVQELAHHFEGAALALIKEKFRLVEQGHQREMTLVEQRGDERVKAARAEALLSHLRWSIPVIAGLLVFAVVVSAAGGYHVGRIDRSQDSSPKVVPLTQPNDQAAVKPPSTDQSDAAVPVKGHEKDPGKSPESQGSADPHATTAPIPANGEGGTLSIPGPANETVQPPAPISPKSENGVPEKPHDGAL